MNSTTSTRAKSAKTLEATLTPALKAMETRLSQPGRGSQGAGLIHEAQIIRAFLDMIPAKTFKNMAISQVLNDALEGRERLRNAQHRETGPMAPHTAVMDIPASFDPLAMADSSRVQMGTQIKTTGEARVMLGDAKRALNMASDGGVRFIVGQWVRRGPVKTLVAIHELEYSKEQWEREIVGRFRIDAVTTLHCNIGSFSRDDAGAHQARLFAQAVKESWADRGLHVQGGKTLLTMNPKIGHNQRRLQCSVNLQDLIRNANRATSWFSEDVTPESAQRLVSPPHTSEIKGDVAHGSSTSKHHGVKLVKLKLATPQGAPVAPVVYRGFSLTPVTSPKRELNVAPASTGKGAALSNVSNASGAVRIRL